MHLLIWLTRNPRINRRPASVGFTIAVTTIITIITIISVIIIIITILSCCSLRSRQ